MKRIVLLLGLALSASGADRYWAGATAGCDGTWADTDCWATTSGGSGPASVPGAADDVFFDGVGNGAANSTIGTGYNTTINSLNMTGYANTLTHNGSATVTIDSTGGLILSATMTYTRLGASSSALAFTATSGTTPITTAGKTVSDVTFNGAGGTFQLQDALTSTGVVRLTQGTFQTNNQTMSVASLISNGLSTRTLTLGSSAITVTGAGFDIQLNATNITYTANTAVITLSGNGVTVSMGTSNLNGTSLTFTGTSSTYSGAGSTVNNLTRTGTAAKTNTFLISSNFTVTGTFTVTGNSTINRVLVASDTRGTRRTITAAAVSMSRVDFSDIEGAGAANWDLSAITGLSGDCLGNVGITFTAATTQTATGSISFTWSTHGWTSRVPLCQDNVVVNNNFTTGRTVTVDMPRIGANVDFGGMSWSGTATTVTISSGTAALYGSLTLKGGMTLTQTSNLELAGRTSHTITSAAVTYSSGGGGVSINAPGATYTLMDAFTTNSGGLNVLAGTFNSNGYTVTHTASGFVSTSGSTRVITMGSSQWVFNSSSGTPWNVTISGLTVNANTSTIEIANTGATSKTFAGAGLSYNILKATGNNILVTGNNTFDTIHLNCPGCNLGLRLPTGGNTTFTTLISAGSAGNLVEIKSDSAANTTLTKASGCVGQDYVAYTWINADGGATWNVGANSTLSNTTGLTAAACSSGRRRPLWVVQ